MKQTQDEIEEINLVAALLKSYEITVKNYKLILQIFSVVFLLGITFYFIKAPVYKTEMIVSSSLVSSERIAIIIEPLGKLVQEKNISELSLLLHIDNQTALEIVDIESKEIKDETKISQTAVYESENCLLTLQVKRHPELYDTIQSGILNFLRQNDFVKRRSDAELTNLSFMKKRIKHEIAELDSLKKRFAFKNNSVMMMDPSAINKNIADLYQQELNLDSKEKLEDGGINVIREFAKFKKPASPKLLMLGLLLFSISIILSVIMIAFKNTIEKRKNAGS